MKNRKKSTFVYHGFGFPIKLIAVPMRKILGHWVIDIEMGKLEIVVLQALLHKPTLLNGDELRFIRKYLSLTTLNLYNTLGPGNLEKRKKEKVHQISINVSEELKSA